MKLIVMTEHSRPAEWEYPLIVVAIESGGALSVKCYPVADSEGLLLPVAQAGYSPDGWTAYQIKESTS